MLTSLFLLPMGMIGPAQIVLIVVLIIVFFGGKKIPELMRGMGRGIKEFKDAVNKDYSADGTANKPNETTSSTGSIVEEIKSLDDATKL